MIDAVDLTLVKGLIWERQRGMNFYFILFYFNRNDILLIVDEWKLMQLIIKKLN